MSSINQNNAAPSAPTERTYTSRAPGTAGVQPAAPTASPDVARQSLVSTDGYARAGGQAADVTKAAPPVASETKPGDYTANLHGAQQNMSAFRSTSSVSPAEMQMLAEENQAHSRAADKNSAELAVRQTKAASQSQSIVASAEETHKKACDTTYSNHQQNVQKMQALGFTKRQARVMVATLESNTVPADVKLKLAYQLAAIGMTGKNGPIAGSSIATNAAGIKQQLGAFADAQSAALRRATGYEMMELRREMPSSRFTDKVLKESGSRLDKALGSTAPTFPDDAINVPTTRGLSSQTLNTASIQGVTLHSAMQNLRTTGAQGA